MAILGIDIGTSASTIATIKDGTIKVVLSDTSERSTPTLVTFLPDRRLFGNESYSQMRTRYQHTVRDVKNYVASDRSEISDLDMFFQTHEGIFFKDGSIEGELDVSGVQQTGEAGFIVPYNKESLRVDARNVLSSYICFLKRLAEKNEKATFTDVVVSVPPYFDMLHRQSIFEALKIANLRVLRLINENVAVALDYGMFRRTELKEFDENESTNKETPPGFIVCFVSMGHTHFGATLASFSSKGFKILGEQFEQASGGRDVNKLLMDHCANIFTEKNTEIDVFGNKRSLLKLEEACEKAKKILSSNVSAAISVECLSEDFDLNVTIYQDDLSKICESLTGRMKACLDQLFVSSEINPSNVSRIEAVGGASRMKIFKDAVRNFFDRDISTTLNASESVARGCALHAALISPSFRVPEYFIDDICFNGIDISWTVDTPEGLVAKKINLFSNQHGLHFGRSKVLTFMRHGAFKLSLVKQCSGKVFVVFSVDCPDSVEDKEVKVRIQLDKNGIIATPEAWIVSQQIEINNSANIESIADQSQPENEASEINAQKYTDCVGNEDSEKIRLVKCAVPIRSVFISGCDALEIENSVEQEKVFFSRDLEVEKILELSNMLEEMIYNIRAAISEGGELSIFLSVDEADNIMKLVEQKSCLLRRNSDSDLSLGNIGGSVHQLEEAISAATKRKVTSMQFRVESERIAKVITDDLSKLEATKAVLRDFKEFTRRCNTSDNDSTESIEFDAILTQQLEQLFIENRECTLLYDEIQSTIKNLNWSDDSAMSLVELKITRMKELSAKNNCLVNELSGKISTTLNATRSNLSGSVGESLEDFDHIVVPDTMDVDGNVDSNICE